MAEETQPSKKAVVMRVWILLFLIGFGLRIFRATVGDAPVAAAAETGQPASPAPAPVEAAPQDNQVNDRPAPVTFVRVGWLSQCEAAPVRQLGLYTADDAPCHPHRAVSLNWLQSQLASTGVLATGEYLEDAPNPGDPTCFAAVLSGPNAAPSGWLCADARGLYRADTNGQAPAARFQLWIQG